MNKPDEEPGRMDSIADNLPLSITDIQPQKRNKERFSLFHKKLFLIGVSLETLSDFSLKKGDLLNLELFHELKKTEDYHAIKESCLGYLSRRAHASFELESKLRKKGYGEKNIQQVIRELSDKGWIDDENFAVSYAAEKAELNRWGPNKIRSALYNKGLGKNLVDKSINEAFKNLQPQQICVDLALKKKRKFLREDDPFKRKQKIYRYLASRGFSSSNITQALPTILNQLNV